MRKLFYLATMFLALFLVSCGGSSGPEGVAKKFLDATENHDFDGCKKYVVNEAKPLFDMAKSMAESNPDMVEDTDIEFVSCTIDEDDENRATCVYLEDGDEETLDLVKIDGEWKVAYEK